MNDYFYKTAFTKAERKKIKKTWLKSSPDPETGENGGSNTQDKIFLLSYEDVTNEAYGYDKHKNEFLGNTVTTAYARAQGAITYDGGQNKYLWEAGSQGEFWLRTPGGSTRFVLSVHDSGFLDYVQRNFGSLVHCGGGVRPVMYISLK